jgi:hypothetical protein
MHKLNFVPWFMDKTVLSKIIALRNWNARKLLAFTKNFVFTVHQNAASIERFLILFAALSGSWFMFFDVYPPSDLLGTFALKSIFWQFVFFSLIALHLVMLKQNKTSWRIFSCLCHSVVWMVWFLLAITAARPTMATPLLIGLFSMGIYEAVRMRLKENE